MFRTFPAPIVDSTGLMGHRGVDALLFQEAGPPIVVLLKFSFSVVKSRWKAELVNGSQSQQWLPYARKHQTQAAEGGRDENQGAAKFALLLVTPTVVTNLFALLFGLTEDFLSTLYGWLGDVLAYLMWNHPPPPPVSQRPPPPLRVPVPPVNPGGPPKLVLPRVLETPPSIEPDDDFFASPYNDPDRPVLDELYSDSHLRLIPSSPLSPLSSDPVDFPFLQHVKEEPFRDENMLRSPTSDEILVNRGYGFGLPVYHHPAPGGPSGGPSRFTPSPPPPPPAPEDSGSEVGSGSSSSSVGDPSTESLSPELDVELFGMDSDPVDVDGLVAESRQHQQGGFASSVLNMNLMSGGGGGGVPTAGGVSQLVAFRSGYGFGPGMPPPPQQQPPPPPPRRPPPPAQGQVPMTQHLFPPSSGSLTFGSPSSGFTFGTPSSGPFTDEYDGYGLGENLGGMVSFQPPPPPPPPPTRPPHSRQHPSYVPQMFDPVLDFTLWMSRPPVPFSVDQRRMFERQGQGQGQGQGQAAPAAAFVDPAVLPPMNPQWRQQLGQQRNPNWGPGQGGQGQGQGQGQPRGPEDDRMDVDEDIPTNAQDRVAILRRPRSPVKILESLRALNIAEVIGSLVVLENMHDGSSILDIYHPWVEQVEQTGGTIIAAADWPSAIDAARNHPGVLVVFVNFRIVCLGKLRKQTSEFEPFQRELLVKPGRRAPTYCGTFLTLAWAGNILLGKRARRNIPTAKTPATISICYRLANFNPIVEVVPNEPKRIQNGIFRLEVTLTAVRKHPPVPGIPEIGAEDHTDFESYQCQTSYCLKKDNNTKRSDGRERIGTADNVPLAVRHFSSGAIPVGRAFRGLTAVKVPIQSVSPSTPESPTPEAVFLRKYLQKSFTDTTREPSTPKKDMNVRELVEPRATLCERPVDVLRRRISRFKETVVVLEETVTRLKTSEASPDAIDSVERVYEKVKVKLRTWKERVE